MKLERSHDRRRHGPMEEGAAGEPHTTRATRGCLFRLRGKLGLGASRSVARGPWREGPEFRNDDQRRCDGERISMSQWRVYPLRRQARSSRSRDKGR